MILGILSTEYHLTITYSSTNMTSQNRYVEVFNGIYSADITNPSKLLFQIVILQSFYYITALVIFYLISSLNGYDFKIDWIFSWELIASDNAMGLILFALWLFDSLLCVLFVTIVVGRSKLAWDFAITIHIINLIVVWLYTGKFPTSTLWWCLQVLSAVLLVTLSTYSTRWKELRTTFFDNMLDQQELGEVDHSNSQDIEMSNLPAEASSPSK
ncbi:DEHA2C17556p [Debaryomyces hansenii CBS767]|uniref:DEHA2C17556p n=1 Tax=Debaryomyces hansenii (strain ATCC 36239 / CBS 767 / BCRC 21394 / JCM 1990 / NBRC 0083 / IGC 2968) TaxID=284592 RepID=Q6BTL4_DEBHA|nr:DEHA2C17556p [Debaryomyces hansenii CBS767]CAG86537.2 DEHA2C17556p [Debaryomyces hansenii CBS767]|eukprot:XP_458455.2 DEHA2C17556p [Debaryomyces hansenii CBS767]